MWRMSEDILIVSGLPRSGTSLMMQMLDAGGVPLLSDGTRRADDSNPAGYYEYEPVKKLKEDNAWLAQAQGKALKVVSPLLSWLPAGWNYKVIFVRRLLTEVLASQQRMLQRQGLDSSAADDEQLKIVYQRHLKEIEAWLAAQQNFQVFYAEYQEFHVNPGMQVEEVANFLGLRLDQQAMITSIKPELYRHRLAAEK
jgi:hypothetical protein